MKLFSSLVITVNHKRFVCKQKPKILLVTTKLLMAGMRNLFIYASLFQSLKRLFVRNFNVHDSRFKRSFILKKIH